MCNYPQCNLAEEILQNQHAPQQMVGELQYQYIADMCEGEVRNIPVSHVWQECTEIIS